jgi:hypothetical protein
MRSLLFVAAAACGFAVASPVVAQTSSAAPAAPASSVTTPIEGFKFDTVVVGGTHACGLTAEGKAYCWGRNDAGQLGDSTNVDHDTPVAVAGGIVFRALTAGGQHTCGITKELDDGYCWGSNSHGQLGNGGRASMSYPFKVSGSLRFALLSAGGRHTCGTELHYDRQQRAVCWGHNKDGQLGDMADEDSAVPVSTFGVIRYTSIAAGDTHSCGSTDKGKVFCWGSNERGELGNASSTASHVPFPARFNRKVVVVQMAAGAAHTCALTGENELFCWGDNRAGQIGNGKSGGRQLSPTSLKDQAGFTAITAGGTVTCALRADASASCWGSAGSILGGSGSAGASKVPTPALSGTTLKAISVGQARGCGVQADGTTICWAQGAAESR